MWSGKWLCKCHACGRRSEPTDWGVCGSWLWETRWKRPEWMGGHLMWRRRKEAHVHFAMGSGTLRSLRRVRTGSFAGRKRACLRPQSVQLHAHQLLQSYIQKCQAPNGVNFAVISSMLSCRLRLGSDSQDAGHETTMMKERHHSYQRVLPANPKSPSNLNSNEIALDPKIRPHLNLH